MVQILQDNSLDNAQLQQHWLDLRRVWFPQTLHLDDYTVVWSGRVQKQTLGSCNVERKRVIVARELNYPEHSIWLKPLLYHEMCHAYLGRQVSNSKRGYAWHGKEFRALERRHPLIKVFNQWVKQGGWELAVKNDRIRRGESLWV